MLSYEWTIEYYFQNIKVRLNLRNSEVSPHFLCHVKSQEIESTNNFKQKFSSHSACFSMKNSFITLYLTPRRPPYRLHPLLTYSNKFHHNNFTKRKIMMHHHLLFAYNTMTSTIFFCWYALDLTIF